MKTLLILTALALSGCAQNQRVLTVAEHRAQAECTYEAEKATAAILNGMEQGFMKGKLTRQCMSLRGYQ